MQYFGSEFSDILWLILKRSHQHGPSRSSIGGISVCLVVHSQTSYSKACEVCLEFSCNVLNPVRLAKCHIRGRRRTRDDPSIHKIHTCMYVSCMYSISLWLFTLLTQQNEVRHHRLAFEDTEMRPCLPHQSVCVATYIGMIWIIYATRMTWHY